MTAEAPDSVPGVQLNLTAEPPDPAAPLAVSGPPSEPASPEELLARLGFSAFRPGQRDAVQAALEGRDSLVVMPTGGGKSLCYQLPALAGRGLVVVVSPLIALMADQLRRLEQAGVRAAMLASGMQEGHNARALAGVRDGSVALVLAAPERFASPAFRDALARRRIALFVIDEAHCLAEWGHDFRPDYLRLSDAIADLGRPPVMAATATATPRVAKEVAERLALRDPLLVRSAFDRPNLTFDVVALDGKGAVARKRSVLRQCLSAPEALPAIVYCGTRRDTERVCATLVGQGMSAVAYHAGLAPEVRRAAQSAFMEGRAQVVVATNAFGMGIDKADVRTVAHWAVPTSLEAYYQEAGRAGRDGRGAQALLLAARADLGRLIRFNTDRATTVADVDRFVGRIARAASGGTLEAGPLRDADRLLLSVAERSGAVDVQSVAGGRLRLTLTGQGLDVLAARRAVSVARDRGWEAYRAIERFMSSTGCRRRALLDHFGDPTPVAPQGRCCDVCDPDGSLRTAAAAEVGERASRRSKGAKPPAVGPPVDTQHMAQLKAWRLGRAQGKPAYTVASDAALQEVLRARPADTHGLLAIRGIGPAFCERHGSSLLDVLSGMQAGAAPGR